MLTIAQRALVVAGLTIVSLNAAVDRALAYTAPFNEGFFIDQIIAPWAQANGQRISIAAQMYGRWEKWAQVEIGIAISTRFRNGLNNDRSNMAREVTMYPRWPGMRPQDNPLGLGALVPIYPVGNVARPATPDFILNYGVTFQPKIAVELKCATIGQGLENLIDADLAKVRANLMPSNLVGVDTQGLVVGLLYVPPGTRPPAANSHPPFAIRNVDLGGGNGFLAVYHFLVDRPVNAPFNPGPPANNLRPQQPNSNANATGTLPGSSNANQPNSTNNGSVNKKRKL